METPKPTLETPVDAETMEHLSELHQRRLQVAGRLLEIEQEKVQLLRAAGAIDHQRQQLFEGILTSRGLAPTATVQIDGTTGRITLLDVPTPEGPSKG